MSKITLLHCEHESWLRNAIILTITVIINTIIIIPVIDAHISIPILLGILWGSIFAQWHVVLWAWLTRKSYKKDQ